MNDLELTRMAAESIGYSIDHEVDARIWKQAGSTAVMLSSNVCWDPLTDASQAFELQEKLRLSVIWRADGKCKAQKVYECYCESDWHDELKTSLTECAASYALWKREQK